MCISKALTFFSLAFDLGKATDVLLFLSGSVLCFAFRFSAFLLSFQPVPQSPLRLFSALMPYICLVFNVGNAVGLLFFLAPTTTLKRIVRSQSTEQFSGVPYVITLLSCSLYTWYGLPFASLDNLLILIMNSMGVGIELTYVLIFITYASKKERAKIVGLSGLALILFLTFAFVSLFALHGKTRKLFCGIMIDISSTVMYASPLSDMMLVIKTKSVEFMPFLLSLSCFLFGIFWLAYGLLSRDPFLIVPNGLGTALGIVQLILYALYRKNCSHSKHETRDEFAAMDLEKTDQTIKAGLPTFPVGILKRPIERPM